MANHTITRLQLDALIAAGIAGDAIEVARLRDIIYTANSIQIYRLNIRWQNVGGQPPPRIELGAWPQDQTFLLELERAIAPEDVDDVLTANAVNPANTMVTPDPNGELGWTLLGDYSFATAT